MIEYTKAFKVGDKTFGTLDEAKGAELHALFPNGINTADLLEKSDAVVDILTTTATSKPKARAIHGGRKPRKAKLEIIKGES